jgi:hypothetical protein
MTTLTDRERLISEIADLDDEEIAALLRYVELMKSSAPPEDYDEENDPAIGFLEGTTDLSMTYKQILRDEITNTGFRKKKPNT